MVNSELRIFDDGETDPIEGNRSAYPRWSWNRTHTWVAIRRADAYDDEQIKILAGHKVVMLEKFNGHETYGSVEKGSLEAARRIKRVNSRVKVLFYLNAMVHYGGYDANESFHEKWALTDRDTGELFKWRNKFLSYDHTNLEFRQWWIERALAVLENDEIDGIFIDGICKTANKPFLPKDHDSAYFATAVELRERLPQGKILIGNALRATERSRVGGENNIKHLTYLDGSYLEGWDANDNAIVRTIDLMDAALRQGRIVMLTSSPFVGYRKTYPKQTEEKSAKLKSLKSSNERYDFIGKFIEFPLGIFLLTYQRCSYFSFNTGVDASPRANTEFDSNWYVQVTQKLGRPKGAYVKEADFVYSREFSHLKVWVNVKTKECKLSPELRRDDEL